MKVKAQYLLYLGLLVTIIVLSSCNTYNWQRKRYYKGSKVKNWNNYNPEKNKKEAEKVLQKYYKK